MNPEPQPAEFDPSEELTNFHDPSMNSWLARAGSSSIWSDLPGHRGHSASRHSFARAGYPMAGCRVEFIVHGHAFWIDTSPTRVRLWAGSIDGVMASNRYLVCGRRPMTLRLGKGYSPSIGHVEKFGVHYQLRRQPATDVERVAHRAEAPGRRERLVTIAAAKSRPNVLG